MADSEPDSPVDNKQADNGDSSDQPGQSPVRKLTTLAPKQSRAYSLPALTDLVPLPEPSSSTRTTERPRHGSFPGAPPPRLFIPGVTTAFIDGLPVQSYLIAGKPYTMQRPDNEGTNECIRLTVDNRRLKYLLNVLQQPQKARACGNGPRASSDRRPVDPPPVVQLKVLDISEGEKDVTMTYDSGFMLYASLEVARPIANGRMHSPPHPPVLTGVAVASAAYLERPNGPSGYFIFPDLSVRHEGWYRLRFSLFEAIKHPQDADCDRPFNQAVDGAAVPGKDVKIVQHQAMANRMEVSSTPFQVFSAKKFPGLEMSTEVSLALAQQGCRVRIRRDIRQRKRVAGDKPKKEPNSADLSNMYSVQQHARTPSLDSQYGYGGSCRELGEHSSVDSHQPHPQPQPQHHQNHQQHQQHQQIPHQHQHHQYPRRTLSRDPSIAALTQPSPTLLLAPQPSMGPPTQVPRSTGSWDSSSPMLPSTPYSSASTPYSATTTTFNGASSQQPIPVMTQPATGTLLPPLPPPPTTLTATATASAPPTATATATATYESAPRPKQYDIPRATAQKRSYSPAQYNQTDALKQGARPDNPPPPPPSAQSWQASSKHGAPIEVDDGDDSDVDYPQYFTFRKSDKSYGSKSFLYPNGMDRLLHRD